MFGKRNLANNYESEFGWCVNVPKSNKEQDRATNANSDTVSSRTHTVDGLVVSAAFSNV